MSVPLVEVTDVGLTYRLPTHEAGSVRELFVKAFGRRSPPATVRALDGVGFAVAAGEVLGVIGPNGAGKSSLMKLLARVLPPSSGRVVVRGRVSPLIELGAGFNPEQTCRENIVLYGTLLGRSRQHLERRAEAIADWAGLLDYLDVPVRAFSSGMVARLAFSVASDVEPDVLLLDEVLAVGDEAFRLKSAERMDGLIASGAAVIMVTHSMPEVLSRSHRALYLSHGRVRAMGDPQETVGAYLSDIQR